MPDDQLGAEAHRLVAEQVRETLEVRRLEQEELRETAETTRIVAEQARHAADCARDVVVAAVRRPHDGLRNEPHIRDS
jgi:hypothetical protein